MASTGSIGTMTAQKSELENEKITDKDIVFLISRPYTCPGGEERTGPCPITDSDRNVLFENRMLGLPRIRQLRVMNDSCQIHPHFQVHTDTICVQISQLLYFREQ